MSDPIRQFAESIHRDTGAVIEPVGDGVIHRFDDHSGKRRNGACWYVLHLDGFPAGAYGNWRTGFRASWSFTNEQVVSGAARGRATAQLEEARRQRDRKYVMAHDAAISLAHMNWNLAVPATVMHPYLARKRISALGLRQNGAILLVPLRDISGALVNLQRIFPDGTKRFLKGGRVTGCFWLLGREIPENGKLYIAEGMATAATIAETLRQPVVAAMNAGNLEAVARAIRTQYPNLALVIAADNDHRTAGNPGFTKAREAAARVGGCVTWPTVCLRDGCTCTDFNDLEHCGRAGK